MKESWREERCSKKEIYSAKKKAKKERKGERREKERNTNIEIVFSETWKGKWFVTTWLECSILQGLRRGKEFVMGRIN